MPATKVKTYLLAKNGSPCNGHYEYDSLAECADAAVRTKDSRYRPIRKTVNPGFHVAEQVTPEYVKSDECYEKVGMSRGRLVICGNLVVDYGVSFETEAEAQHRADFHAERGGEFVVVGRL